MHELSLIAGLLEVIDAYERRHGFKRVTVLKLAYGRLSCIDSGALQFAFDLQSRGTIAEDAALLFDIRPVVVYCPACDLKTIAEGCTSSCPHCGGADVEVQGGTESLQLVEMEVD